MFTAVGVLPLARKRSATPMQARISETRYCRPIALDVVENPAFLSTILYGHTQPPQLTCDSEAGRSCPNDENF